MARATVAELKEQFHFNDEQANEMFELLSAFTDEEIATGRASGSNPPKGLISDDTSENEEDS